MNTTNRNRNEITQNKENTMSKSTKSKATKSKKSTKRPAAKTTERAPRTFRHDPRLPAVGSTIQRTYKGRELTIAVAADGLVLDGTTYASASALARAVTGYPSVNGMLWLGLGKPGAATKPEPKARKPRAAAKAKA